MHPLPNSQPVVHLHWIRETSARGLAAPVSETLTSLDGLPDSVRNLVRTAKLPEVEIQLPLSRSADTRESDWTWTRTGHTFHARHEEDGPDAQAHLLAVILAIQAATCSEVPVTICAPGLPAGPFGGWASAQHICRSGGGLLAAPAERTRTYSAAYRPLSLRVQALLRSWLPATLLADPVSLASRNAAWPLLVWSAASPVTGEHVDRLAIDPLDSGLIRRALHGAAPRLESLLAVAERHAPEPVRHAYSPSKAGAILAEARRASQRLRPWFAAESRLVTALAGYLSRIPAWKSQSAQDSARLYRDVRIAWQEVESLLRKPPFRDAATGLPAHLLLESVRVLEALD